MRFTMTTPRHPGGPRQPHPPHTASTPSGASIERLGEVLGELRTLLDSSRNLLRSATSELIACGGGVPVSTGDLERDLGATAERLERMAELVHAAMQNATKPLGSPNLSRARPVSLGEAVSHAIEVVTPLATAHEVKLSSFVGAAMGLLPAGGLYTVILNALQNAIEAVASRGGSGNVTLTIRPQAAPDSGYGRDARDWYVLEVTDDGVGLPQDSSRCFDLGFSTKPRGAGVGLAVARSVVQGMGGSIELTPRPNTGGSVFRARFPSLTRAANMVLGGRGAA